LQSGKTLGVFQLDSEGIRDLVRKLKPSAFSDIMALVALYRPGPMKSGMVNDFVARKHGEKKVAYEHALLKPILQDTYGCMVYQEQVMEISKSLAGFTAGQADGLRKAMGKKIPAELEKQRGDFVKGCKKNGIADKLANKVYDQMCEFGGYGFNKSHSAAYGLVAYQTAWMKANYPLEFMTALLTSEIGHSAMVEGKENKLVTYLDEAKAMGLAVLPPDVQKSEVFFSMEGPAIRFGLVAIKNVGQGAAESILEARASGPFASLDDFCRRVDLKAANRKVLESLVKAGAMDCLQQAKPVALGRAALNAILEETMDRQARIKEDVGRGQGLLFGANEGPPPSAASPDVQPLHEHDVLKSEKEVLGFYLSGHPLVRYKDRLAMVSTHTIDKLGPEVSGQIRVAGMVAQVKKLLTKEKGEQYARGVLEDLTGEITVLVFPRKYAEGLGKLFNLNAIVTIAGRLSFRGDAENQAPELIADEILPIDHAVARLARRLTIPFSTAALEKTLLEDLRRVLAKHPGRCPVTLRLDTPAHGTALVETETSVRLEESLFDDLERILGEKTWQIESAS
ncbi:MAG: DNA polymerase III subunit alpha, partial [Elusimicrobia bacterium]|nr:DNA polymerase III subunit alpha [Elusimicrobiota bacterium]